MIPAGEVARAPSPISGWSPSRSPAAAVGLHLYTPGRAGEQQGEPFAKLAKRVAQQLKAGDARVGHLDHDQKPAGREGGPGLEPEQRLGRPPSRSLRGRTQSDRRGATHLAELDDSRTCVSLYDEVLTHCPRDLLELAGCRCPGSGVTAACDAQKLPRADSYGETCYRRRQ